MNILDWTRNEIAYRSGQIADFWEPKLRPVLNNASDLINSIDKAHSDFVDNNPISSLAKDLPVPGQDSFSEIDQAEGKLTDFVRQAVQATGLDPRLTGLALGGLTITNPKFLAKGIKKGSASSPQWLPQTREFDMRAAAATEKFETAQRGRSKSAKQRTKEALYNDVSTGPTRDPINNGHTYGDPLAKVQSEITPFTATGNPRYKQQHHLFSKQESYQFVNRMRELGDDDDVLNMFLYAEDLNATMGGRLQNMLDMEDKPHNLLHASRKRKVDGRELKAAEMRNLVENAKSTTELMKIFNEYIMNNVLPSIDEAKAFKIIGERMLKEKKYGFMDELYDKNLLRKPKETV